MSRVEESLKPRFEHSPERLIVGLNETYTFQSRIDISKQWDRFGTYWNRLPNQVGKVCYGVCWNFIPGRGFDYIAGVEVNSTENTPSEFTQVRLPAGKYAVFVHDKHVSEIPQTIQAIWSVWLPSSGLQIGESPSFERYSDAFDPTTGRGGMEIWIPVCS